jgi:CHAT domain-containing protein/tetratricopeptide (TPR) repeat protein
MIPLLVVAPSVRAQDTPSVGSRIRLAETQINRGQHLESIQQLQAALLEADVADESKDVSDRDRRRILFLLTQQSRWIGDHASTVTYGVEYERRLDGLPAAQSLRRENLMLVADSLIARRDFSEASFQLNQLLSNPSRYGQLPKTVRLGALVRVALIRVAADPSATPTELEKSFRLAQEILAELRTRQNLKLAADSRSLQECLTCLALCLDIKGKSETVDKVVFGKMLKADQKHLKTEMRSALSYWSEVRGDTRRALEHLKAAVRETDSDQDQAAFQLRLGALYRSAGDFKAADEAFQNSVKSYEELLAAALNQPQNVELAVALLARLQTLHIASGRTLQAIDAAQRQYQLVNRTRGAGHVLTVQSGAALGAVLAHAGRFAEADGYMARAVGFWEAHADESPLRLAAALSNRGTLALAVGNVARATEHFQKALKLHETLKRTGAVSKAELTLRQNYANALASAGQYSRAETVYKGVLDRTRDAPGLNGVRAVVFSNLAALYKSQGLLDRASSTAIEATDLTRTVFGPASIELARCHTLIAAIKLAERDLPRAYSFGQEALAIVEKTAGRNVSVEASVHYRLGTISMSAGATDSAEFHFQRALKLYGTTGQRVLESRVRNRLALLSILARDFTTAESMLRETLTVQEQLSAPPQDRYSVLCNLAYVLDALKRREEAQELLNQADAIVELPRAASIGAERERAEFLARFADSYQLQYQWALEAGDFDSAFAASERTTNRTLLDQLDLAGIDLRELLTGDNAAQLKDREKELATELISLTTEAASLRTGAPTDSTRAAGAIVTSRMRQTRQDYQKIWTEIRNATPVYRETLAGQKPATLVEFQLSLATGEVALLYHISSQSSSVLVIRKDAPVEAIQLDISSTAADALSRAITVERSKPRVDGFERGPGSVVTAARGEKLTARSPSIESGRLKQETAERLVYWYLQQLRGREFGTERGAGPRVVAARGKTGTKPYVELGNVLFPVSLRDRLKQKPAKSLLIIPSGPLHHLPLESLVFSDSPETRYGLDELPPISYGPSASIFVKLRNRSNAAGQLNRGLTIGDPAYPIPPGSSDEPPRPPTREEFAHGLPRLPGTQRECEQVFHSMSGVCNIAPPLLGHKASESAARKRFPGQQFIHVAAHGLVDQQFDNLFGAIALSSGSGPSSDDGFLRYHEIVSLDLRACQLAVLSACQTNVAPDRPLEAGASLAQAFIAAGASRVIASHWSVPDESTAELIASMFGHVAIQMKSGTTVNFSKALHDARVSIRATKKWESPYHWAPFVLIGPGTRMPQ